MKFTYFDNRICVCVDDSLLKRIQDITEVMGEKQTTVLRMVLVNGLKTYEKDFKKELKKLRKKK